MTLSRAAIRDIVCLLSVMYAESPVLQGKPDLSPSSPTSGQPKDTPGRVVSALWTSVGPVGYPRLPLIVDELQVALRGKGYD